MGKEGTERIEDKVRNTLVSLKKEKESSDQRTGSVTKESERLKGYWMGYYLDEKLKYWSFIPLEEVKC